MLYLVNLVAARREGPLLVIILAPLGYLAALLLGVPAYYVMQRRGISSLRGYLLLGALIGLIFDLLFFGIQASLSLSSYPEHALALLRNGLGAAPVAVVYALVACTVFWLVAVRNRS